jgi:hypothetical protein
MKEFIIKVHLVTNDYQIAETEDEAIQQFWDCWSKEDLIDCVSLEVEEIGDAEVYDEFGVNTRNTFNSQE